MGSAFHVITETVPVLIGITNEHNLNSKSNNNSQCSNSFSAQLLYLETFANLISVMKNISIYFSLFYSNCHRHKSIQLTTEQNNHRN